MAVRRLVLGDVFPLASGPWPTFSPFLFAVHHDDNFPAAAPGGVAPAPAELRGRAIGSDFSGKDGWSMYHGDTLPGFPVHPHRGFETVTVTMRSVVDHFDSTGAVGRYGDGDAQWMTAGRGVQHSEMFALRSETSRNPMELFQLWLNLPRASKMAPPAFKMLWAEQVPVVSFPVAALPAADPAADAAPAAALASTVRVIAGSYPGAAVPPSPPPDSWAAAPENDVHIFIVSLPAVGASVRVPPSSSASANRALYAYHGKGVGRARVTSPDLSDGPAASVVLGDRRGARVDASLGLTLTAEAGPIDVLIIGGAAINEPVVQHGPFVMNTEEEIAATFSDFRRTRFGGWEWSRDDPFHARDVPRFARASRDGALEFPPGFEPPANLSLLQDLQRMKKRS